MQLCGVDARRVHHEEQAWNSEFHGYDTDAVLSAIFRLQREGREVNVETNDSVMKKCFAFGCACHGANNFAKDLLKFVPMKSVFDRAWSVGKYFRNKHRAKAAYEAECRKAYGKTLALVTLSETRWLTSYLMVLSVRRVKTALKQTTLSEEFDVTEDIKQSVLSNDFWKGIDAFCIFLKPVLDVCTIFEADSSPLSYVVPGHMCLKLHLALAVDCDEIAPLADAAGILDMVTIAAAKVDARYKSVHTWGHMIPYMIFMYGCNPRCLPWRLRM
jgi:hypothetical protein